MFRLMPFGNSWLYFMNAGVADDRGKEMQEFSFSGSIHVPKKPSVWNRNDGHLTFGETKRPSLKSPSHCFTQFKEGEKIPFFHFVAFVFTWWWWELKMKKMKKNNLFFFRAKIELWRNFFSFISQSKKMFPFEDNYQKTAKLSVATEKIRSFRLWVSEKLLFLSFIAPAKNSPRHSGAKNCN